MKKSLLSLLQSRFADPAKVSVTSTCFLALLKMFFAEFNDSKYKENIYIRIEKIRKINFLSVTSF